MGLPYSSTAISPLDRISRIAARYRKKLSLGPYQPVHEARRPRYMRRARFDDLKREIQRRERRTESNAVLRWAKRR